MTDDKTDRNISEILEIIKRGQCFVWVGSGLSRIDYPGWPETIRELCTSCCVDTLEKTEVRADRLIDKAEECKKKNKGAYEGKLADIFGRSVGKTRHAFGLLMKLPFRGYITTNFDPLLSSAGNDTNLYAYPHINPAKLEEVGSIFYIHGLARHGDEKKGDNLVLARSDFNAAYNGGLVHSFLVTLLTYLL